MLCNSNVRAIMKAKGRGGDKQGPLLMGDDFDAELAQVVGEGKENPDEGEAIAKALAGFNPPKDGDWKIPAPPEEEDATVVAEAREAQGYPSGRKVLYLPPFPLLCRTDGLGVGKASAGVLKDGDHGSFDLLAAAGPGQYSHAMSSPCNHFHADGDGWAKISFSLVIWGQGIVAMEQGGHGELEIGVFAAHCHPKQEGKYWQEAGISIKSAGKERYENRVLKLESYFPVKKGIDYSFGTGVTAKAWAWGNAAAGVRLWGRQTHSLITLTDKGPVSRPY